jgi:hypothetical protein
MTNRREYSSQIMNGSEGMVLLTLWHILYCYHRALSLIQFILHQLKCHPYTCFDHRQGLFF